MFNGSPRAYAATGALKINSTGSSMSRSKKMPPEFVKTMPRLILPSSATSHSISCARIPPLKVVSRLNDCKLGGTMATSLGYSPHEYTFVLYMGLTSKGVGQPPGAQRQKKALRSLQVPQSLTIRVHLPFFNTPVKGAIRTVSQNLLAQVYRSNFCGSLLICGNTEF